MNATRTARHSAAKGEPSRTARSASRCPWWRARSRTWVLRREAPLVCAAPTASRHGSQSSPSGGWAPCRHSSTLARPTTGLDISSATWTRPSSSPMTRIVPASPRSWTSTRRHCRTLCTAGGQRPRRRDHDESSPLFLSYTSGTTGDPKGVVLTSGAVTLGAACIAERLRYGMNDVLVATTPVASSFQLVASAMPALHAGAHVVLAAGHHPGEVWEDISAHGGTVLVAYPLTLADVVGLAREAKPAHGLRLALSGGSPLAPRIKRDYREHLGIPLAESYGQSELGGFMVLGTPGDDSAGPGLPLPDRLAFVAGPDNRELPAGGVGEVVVAEGFLSTGTSPTPTRRRHRAAYSTRETSAWPPRRVTSRCWVASRRPTTPSAGAGSCVRWRTPPTTIPRFAMRRWWSTRTARFVVSWNSTPPESPMRTNSRSSSALVCGNTGGRARPARLPRTFSGKADRLRLSTLHGA